MRLGSLWAITRRELFALFVTPIAYFVMGTYLFLSAFFFFNYYSNFHRALYENAALSKTPNITMNLNDWVIEVYFHSLVLLLVFVVPLLTMRAFSEERKRGTLELLMTIPVTVRELVLGKFLALLILLLLMCLLSFFYPLMLFFWGAPAPEWAPVLSGAVGVFLCAAAFLSLALAMSTFSENQVVSGISSMALLLLLYVIFWPAQSLGGYGEELLMAVSPVWQVSGWIDGVVGLSSSFYFISLIALGLFSAVQILEMQRWR
ncbi:MAG: ABC transporter permease subunit [Deltaproteobacteria bacterium]|nr:ABC transporter permease subunit [Deltaproteobacteria bacterium]